MLTTVGELPVVVVNPEQAGPAARLLSLSTSRCQSQPADFSTNGLEDVVCGDSSKLSCQSEHNSPIDPLSGKTGTPIPVGNDPGELAASSDGAYLYVSLNGDHTVQRINLQSLQVERTFTLPTAPNQSGATSVVEMQVVPGSPQSLLASLSSGAALFNDSGPVSFLYSNFGVPGNKFYSFTKFAFTSDPNTAYGYPFYGNFFATLSIGPNTLTTTGTGAGCCDETTGSLVSSDGSKLYTNSGQVWDAKNQTLLGTFTLDPMPGATTPSLFYETGILADAATSRAFIFDTFYGFQNTAGYADIFSFDPSTYKQAGSLSIPIANYTNSADLVRWGANGFAFRVYDSSYSSPASNQVVILRSSIAQTATGGTPVLSAMAPASASAGSTAILLTVNGSGFLAGSTVQWNGGARQTTYVSFTQLTASIPASDLAAFGVAQVTVANPSGGSSSALNFNISGPQVTLSVDTLNFGAQQVGAASSAAQIVITNSGSAPLTGFAAAIVGPDAGSFSETSTCGATVATGASCDLNVNFGPVSSGAKAASLTLTDNAANAPQVVALAGTGAIPSLTVSAPSLQFGTEALATITSPQTVTITNSGAVPLNSLGLSISGPNAPDFAQSSTCAATLAASASCPVNITFTPSIAAAEQASLSIAGANATTQTVALAGAGIAAGFAFAPLSGTSTASTIQSGQPATYNLSVAGAAGFSGTITFSCGNLPQYASCAFSPASLKPTPGASSNVTVIISTQQTNTSANTTRISVAALGFVALLSLMPVIVRGRYFQVSRRSSNLILLLVVAVFGTLAVLSGCGSSSAPNSDHPPATSTPPGSYTISVVATSGTVSHSMSITLVVQ